MKLPYTCFGTLPKKISRHGLGAYTRANVYHRYGVDQRFVYLICCSRRTRLPIDHSGNRCAYDHGYNAIHTFRSTCYNDCVECSTYMYSAVFPNWCSSEPMGSVGNL
jgi:hypothetical protein